MEGAIFVTGAAVQWLRDGLGIIADAAEIGPLAASVPDTGGVMFVPAFTGLGSPYWDPYARGTILGLTRGTGRAQLAPRRRRGDGVPDPRRRRRDHRGDAAARIAELRVDGGASVMDVLCQFQADVLGVTVRRPVVQETTALGAAYLAGIADGRVGDGRRGRRELDRGGGVPARDARPRGRRRHRDVAARRRPVACLGRRGPGRLIRRPDRGRRGRGTDARRVQGLRLEVGLLGRVGVAVLVATAELTISNISSSVIWRRTSASPSRSA